MINDDEVAKVLESLELARDDPMWADHAEVSKQLLGKAVRVITHQRHIIKIMELRERPCPSGDPANPYAITCKVCGLTTSTSIGYVCYRNDCPSAVRCISEWEWEY